MAVRIQLRRDTEANWIAANPLLAAGEAAFTLDKNELKIGDGTRIWTELAYISPEDKTPELIALINANTAAISTETAARQQADAGLSDRITDLEENPSVPEGLVEQVGNNTTAINNQASQISSNTTAINSQAAAIEGLIQTDENLADAINGKLGLPQGELTDLKQDDWLLIGRTDPNLGTTPTYLSRLSKLTEAVGGDDTALTARVDDLEEDVSTLQNQFAGGSNLINALDGRVTVNEEAIAGLDVRLQKLEEGTEPPVEEGFGVYNFAGETWWGQPKAGELWMNFGENQFFMSTTDADGKNLKSFYQQLAKGQSIAVQGPNGFGRFLLKAAPAFGSGENGDYFTIAVREEYVQGEMEIGDRIVLSLEENRQGNYGFEVEAVSEDPIAELVETVARMKKELTALKGQVTRLKNGK